MKIVLVGANNPEVLRLIEDWEADMNRKFANMHKIVGFVDNDPKVGKSFGDIPVFGGFECLPDLVSNGFQFVNLVTGNTKKRAIVTENMIRSRCLFTNFIHPCVNLRMVKKGWGVYIQDHVILQAGAAIEDHVSIHTGAIVAHECNIGANSFIAHGACLSGKVEVGEGVFVGANATILPRIKIGKWATVGAGAVVTKDVPAGVTVVGNPARELKKERQ